MSIRGGCLCGGVRYEIDGRLGNTAHCHCSMCRRAHGAAFGTFATVKPAVLRWLSGQDLLTVYESSPGVRRYFCRRCGSPLGAGMGGGELDELAVGTVDGEPGVRPRCHIFVASKAPWFEITDDLPRYQEWPR